MLPEGAIGFLSVEAPPDEAEQEARDKRVSETKNNERIFFIKTPDIFGFAECEIFSLLRKCEIRFAYEIFGFAEYDIFSFSKENENVWLGIKYRGQP